MLLCVCFGSFPLMINYHELLTNNLRLCSIMGDLLHQTNGQHVGDKKNKILRHTNRFLCQIGLAKGVHCAVVQPHASTTKHNVEFVRPSRVKQHCGILQWNCRSITHSFTVKEKRLHWNSNWFTIWCCSAPAKLKSSFVHKSAISGHSS